MNDNVLATLASRLDALELKAMDAELAQATLDGVVLRQSKDISALRTALATAAQRLDALGGPAGSPDESNASDGSGSLAASLEQERPPHY